MNFTVTGKTTFLFENRSVASTYAVDFLKRDFEKVFAMPLQERQDAQVRVRLSPDLKMPEQYCIQVSEKGIQVDCSDELGMIYGVLQLSRWLGVDDFWFWTEKEPEQRAAVEIHEGTYKSPEYKVRYRGWFVNDEVCLIGWSDVYPPSRRVWETVFETLLRVGGNMVIPGTDLPREGGHFDIASEMGLYITHHHAEPLGGEMFLRAYPDKEPSYALHPDLFEKLWQDAIDKNKDKKIVWTLGFRGQGDAPFWTSDPRYKTPESRGQVIRQVIDRQYEMICKAVENSVCAVYLYGEITELYEGGYLELPEHFIKIWSDNGYGKMVTRRQGTHNLRIPSLPKQPGRHGLYYHVTFHDLQASSHLAMLTNPPEFINQELDRAFEAGAADYLLLNCGNIRPHIYFLDLVRRKWQQGSVDIKAFKKDFFNRYFAEEAEKVQHCYRQYFNSVLHYGPNEDDTAGDEFYYHTARRLAVDWSKREAVSKGLVWATGEIPLGLQVRWILKHCKGPTGALSRFEKLEKQCLAAAQALSDPTFFEDGLLLQVRLHIAGLRGLVQLCNAYQEYEKKLYPYCFVSLSDAMDSFSSVIQWMEKAEHGKWKNFYSCDWLTNVRVSVYAMDSMRRHIRMISDGPDFFSWFKNYVMPETERKIYLENTQRRTLSDDELACKLREVFAAVKR